jgi:hypothetical protein
MADRSSHVHRATATHGRTDDIRTLDLASHQGTQNQYWSPVRLEVPVSLCQYRSMHTDLAQRADVDITASLYSPS